jgi:hypothetical protein
VTPGINTGISARDRILKMIKMSILRVDVIMLLRSIVRIFQMKKMRRSSELYLELKIALKKGTMERMIRVRMGAYW